MLRIGRICMVLSLLTLAFLPMKVMGQEETDQITFYELYIPNVEYSPRQAVGAYPPVEGDQDCPFGYKATKQYPNGTTFEQIASDLFILKSDLDINEQFFPNRVIDAYWGVSAVCRLNIIYDAYADASSNPGEGLRIHFPAGRPDLSSDDQVSSAQSCSALTTAVTTAEVGSTWGGVPVIGSILRGSKEIGKVLCGIPTFPASWSKWVRFTAWSPIVAEALPQIFQASTQGQLSQPLVVELSEGQSVTMIDFAVRSETGSLICNTNIVQTADSFLVPVKRKQFIAHGTVGCLIVESQPNLPEYSWEVLDHAAIMIVTKELVAEKPIITGDSAEYVQEVVEFLDWQYDNRNRPSPITTDPQRECPRLAGIELRDQALVLTINEVAWRMTHTPNDPTLPHTIYFADHAVIVSKEPMEDRYEFRSKKWLANAQFHTINPDDDNFHWTVMVFCGRVGDEMVWLIHPGEGRLRTGLGSSFHPVELIPRDYERYAFSYSEIL